MGIAGRHCRHCTLDDLITGWELRLFQLTAVGRGGGQLSAEDAVQRAQQAARQRTVGRGGLNEEAGNAVRLWTVGICAVNVVQATESV